MIYLRKITISESDFEEAIKGDGSYGLEGYLADLKEKLFGADK